MKVVLTKDIKGVGREHEAVETTDGYALNYLIPAKLAVPATPSALKAAQMRQKQALDRKEIDAKLLAQNITALAETKLLIKVKANEKGHLYDAVGKPELSLAAREQAHIDLPEGIIKLEKPIKELGTFEIPVAVGDTFGAFSVEIAAE